MKKLFVIGGMVLVASMLFSCCGKDYRTIIPADSFFVASVNPESLSEKAEVGDFSRSVFYKMAERGMEDMPVEMRERLLVLLAHPSQTGVDVSRDVFLFGRMSDLRRNDPEMGLVCRLADRKRFDALMDWAEDEIGLMLTEEEGLRIGTMGEDRDLMVVAYDDEVLLLFYTPVAGVAEAKAEVKTLFAQKKSESLLAVSGMARVLDERHDMNFAISYGPLMEMSGGQFGMVEASGFEFLSDMFVTMPVDFEKGKVVSVARVFFGTEEAERAYKEEMSCYDKLQGGFLKLLPAENIAILAGNMNGARMYENLSGIPMYSMAMAMVPGVRTILEAIDGDVALSFHGVNPLGYPELSLLVELKDPAVLETIREMIPLPVVQTGADRYRVDENDLHIGFGLNGNLLYATTSECALPFLTSGKSSGYEKVHGGLFRNTYGTVFVDFAGVRGMIEGLIARGEINPTAAASLAVLNLFESLEITSRTERQADMMLRMTDKERNAAEVLYKTIEGFAQMYLCVL